MSYQIKVSGLGKKYKRYQNRWGRLIEWSSLGKIVTHESRWVLRDISFALKSGESLGIIGVNGAGKSTLLKLLTKTSVPNEGHIEMNGSVAALLELGMGFHPDFTGKANAIMTCQMMGFSKEEACSYIPEIKEFSELGDYLEQPVRIYSTGMQIRLAFSAATVIRPDILIVDEALSVGDAYFQHKCISKIRDYRDSGTTLLFVSHDPGAVKALCSRAILLDEGSILKDGSPDSVLDYYNSVIARKNSEEEIRQVTGKDGLVSTRSGSGRARIQAIDMLDEHGSSIRTLRVGEQVTIHCRVVFNTDMKNPAVGILFRDRMGNDVFGTNSIHLGYSNMAVKRGERYDYFFSISMNVGVGNYSMSVAVHSGDSHLDENCDWWDRCLAIQVIAGAMPQFVGVAALPAALEIKK